MTLREELQRRHRITRIIWWSGSVTFVVLLLLFRGRGILPPLFILAVWCALLLYYAHFRCPRCGARIVLQSRISGQPLSIQRIAQECSRCGLSFDTPLNEPQKV